MGATRQINRVKIFKELYTFDLTIRWRKKHKFNNSKVIAGPGIYLNRFGLVFGMLVIKCFDDFRHGSRRHRTFDTQLV